MKLIYALGGFVAGVAVALASDVDASLVATSAPTLAVVPGPAYGVPELPGDDDCRWRPVDLGPNVDYDQAGDDALVWRCYRTDVRAQDLRGPIL